MSCLLRRITNAWKTLFPLCLPHQPEWPHSVKTWSKLSQKSRYVHIHTHTHSKDIRKASLCLCASLVCNRKCCCRKSRNSWNKSVNSSMWMTFWTWKEHVSVMCRTRLVVSILGAILFWTVSQKDKQKLVLQIRGFYSPLDCCLCPLPKCCTVVEAYWHSPATKRMNFFSALLTAWAGE